MTYRIVVIADVGAAPLFHLGDEAMLESALLELGGRLPVHWTVVSANPNETARRYEVDAVVGFGFAALGSESERDARLQHITDVVEGRATLAPTDTGAALLDALTDADAVLIGGGGNLNSTWPAHIYERAALARVAHLLRAPLAVGGQSIGPELSRRDGELASAALTGAHLVGVREEASAGLALRLGVPAERIWRTCDDAAFMPSAAEAETLADLGLRSKRFVAVTINPFAGLYPPDAMVAPYATLVDEIVDITGLDVVLVPHVGVLDRSGDSGGDDVSYHAAVQAASTSARITAAPILASAAVAGLTRAAAMVVSNRYHPVVFALSAGVPAVGITVDAYTDSKIRGVAELSGMSSWCVSVLGLQSGVVTAAVKEAWTGRAEISDRISEAVGPMEKEKSRYWDALAGLVAGEPEIAVPPASDAHTTSEFGAARGAWTVRNQDALEWGRQFSSRHSDWVRERGELEQQLRDLAGQVREERVERCAAADEVTMLSEALTVERGAARTAQHLNADLVEQHRESAARFAGIRDDLALGASKTEELEQRMSLLQRDSAALDALQRSKLMRWSAPARAVYRSYLRARHPRGIPE